MTSPPPLAFISADDPPGSFPPVAQALKDPNGLLAVGGDLSIERLLAAYQRGIFPWYGEGEPILWWSPNPRTVFLPDHIHVSRRLARTMRQARFTVTADKAFSKVIQACAEPRTDQEGGDSGTWLLPEMRAAYQRLHDAGHAHSIEVWLGDEIVGGLYGVAVGRVFCAESMFSHQNDASKIALVYLGDWALAKGFKLIDAQVGSAHLYRMGAMDIPREDLVARLPAEPIPKTIHSGD